MLRGQTEYGKGLSEGILKQYIVDNIRKLIKLRHQRISEEALPNSVESTYFEELEDFVEAVGKNCIIEWRLAQSIATKITARNIVKSWLLCNGIQMAFNEIINIHKGWYSELVDRRQKLDLL